VDIGDVTVDTFAAREGERFTIAFEDGELELELAEVERMPEEWGRTERREPFSVIFHGSIEYLLPQQVWPLRHDDLGRLDVFLVPLGPEGEAMRYQAIFT
jgi:hypothetical protein